MCLSTVWPKKKQKEWLKKQKSPLIVYSGACRCGKKYYPYYYNRQQPYKAGINESHRKYKVAGMYQNRYVPHYHRFLSHRAARESCSGTILKWRCYKKDITDIGTQWGQTVIIARKLTLLGEVKPKKKKKKSA